MLINFYKIWHQLSQINMPQDGTSIFHCTKVMSLHYLVNGMSPMIAISIITIFFHLADFFLTLIVFWYPTPQMASRFTGLDRTYHQFIFSPVFV